MPVPSDNLSPVTDRPNYYASQYLLEDDFELEQQYHIDRLRRHHRLLHVAGIVHGLEVSWVDTAKTQIKVTAGTAIDTDGRQIVLAQDRSNISPPGTIPANDSILFICYESAETSTQGTTAAQPAGGTATASNQTATNPASVSADGNNRIKEEPVFGWADSVPEGAIALVRVNTAKELNSGDRPYSGIRLPSPRNLRGQGLTLRYKGDGRPPATGQLELAEFAGNLSVTGTLAVTNNIFLGNTASGSSKLLLTNWTTSHYIRAKDWWTEFVSHPNQGWKFISVGANSDQATQENTAIERMRVTSSGNVGIGTPTPQGFHVDLPEASRASASPGVSIAGGSTGNASIELRNKDTGSPFVDFSISSTVDYDARIRLTASDKLAIEGANLGIGTTDPNEKLEVNGNLKAINATLTGTLSVTSNIFLGNVAANGSKLLLTNWANSHYIRAKDWWTEFVSHPNQGWKFISIGGDTDTAAASAPREERMKLAGKGTVGLTVTPTLTATANNDSLMAVRINPTFVSNPDTLTGVTQNALIVERGNVGVGTTTPSEKLEVNGNIKATNATLTGTLSVTGTSTLTGNATLSGTLQVNELTRLGNRDYSSGTVLSVAPGTVQFDAPGVPGGRLHIDGASGNVGIGTTSAERLLEIGYPPQKGAGKITIRGVEVTGTETRFKSQLSKGDGIVVIGSAIGTAIRQIKEIANDITLTLESEFPVAIIDSDYYVYRNNALQVHGSTRLGDGNFKYSDYHNSIASIDPRTNLVLSVAPGIVQFDSPSVPGGRLHIGGDGYVGIGTPAPQAKLHIAQRYNSTFFRMDELQLDDKPSGRNFSIGYDDRGNGNVCFKHSNGYGQHIDQTGSWVRLSDFSLKEKISSLNGLLDKVMQLRPVHFTWKKSQTQDIGFIAQEVEQVFPEFVSSSSFDGESLKGLCYSAFGVLAIRAIQEMHEKVKALETEIQQLKAQFS